MTVPFVDADVVIRLLAGDDPVKQAAARSLFDAVEVGNLVVATPVTTIADAAYVLVSPRLYALPRPEAAALLSALARLPGFRVRDRRIVLRALDLFGATRLDFGDAMIVAAMEHAGESTLYSYDKDFDRQPGIARREP